MVGPGVGHAGGQFACNYSMQINLKTITKILNCIVCKKKGLDSEFKGVLHLWALFLKTFCIFSKNKATLDKETYASGQICSKELKNHSFTSVEAIVVKLQ